MTYLLDTHVWIWINASPEKLSPKVRKLLTENENSSLLLVSAISLVEFATLVKKGKIKFSLAADAWIQAALNTVAVRIVPVTESTARETARLDGFDHFDPSDRIIAATARLEKAVLITADRALRKYRKVATLW